MFFTFAFQKRDQTTLKTKNPASSPALYLGEEVPGLRHKDKDLPMNKATFEKLFSIDRTAKYFSQHPGDDAKSMLHYQSNIEISEAFYPTISNLEVALRNSINHELSVKFGASDWYNFFPSSKSLNKLAFDISKAQNQIIARKELVSPSKVVAELTLGFLVRLFNVEFEMVLWKDLRKAFPFMPKQSRQRKIISAPLNRIRNLRNRTFHNEPVCWNLKLLKSQHYEILEVMEWINPDLAAWTKSFDRFDHVLSDISLKI